MVFRFSSLFLDTDYVNVTRSLLLQFASTMPSRSDDRDPARVFLGNLPHDTRERDIERFFDKYGRVYNIFIKNGKYGFCVSTPLILFIQGGAGGRGLV